MAALLSGDIPGRNFKKKDSLVEHLEDCRRMGIEVVPPSVQTSDPDFAVRDGKIYFGLSAIKSCGGGAADAISEERRAGGPFRDLFDFCERVEVSACNRATIETLVKAGAFDWTGGRRRQLFEALERAMQAGASAQADRRSGQRSLFELDDEDEAEAAVPLPDVPEFEERELLGMEKEVLGYYLTSHPLSQYEQKLSSFCSHTTTELSELPDRREVIVGGMLSAIKMAHTKNGRPGAPTKYANFDLEDMQGAVRCILWPDDFEQYGEQIVPDAVVIVRGAIDRRGGGDEVNLIANEVLPIDELEARYTSGIVVRVDVAGRGPEILTKVREVVRGYPGSGTLALVLRTDLALVRLESKTMGVEVSQELRDRLNDLLGPGNFQLMIQRPRVAATPQRPARRNGRQTVSG